MDVAVDVIVDNADKIDGVKISLLDKDKEIAMRRRLPQGVTHVYRRRFELRRTDSR